jgi:lysophospholipase L1-like esterase
MATHIPTPAPHILNNLCFGDSLTEGYSEYGTKMTPYGTTTLAYLTDRLGPLPEVHLCVEGKSGDLVSAGFSRRMERVCRSPSSAGGHESLQKNATKWDWLVFLGGTNDLGYGRSVEAIWETILLVTSIPMTRGAKVLLLTVPECSAKHTQLDRSRRELNEKIRGDDREGVYVSHFPPLHEIVDADLGAGISSTSTRRCLITV